MHIHRVSPHTNAVRENLTRKQLVCFQLMQAPRRVAPQTLQVVTSAFRPIPQAWASLSRLNVVVSIDGLEANPKGFQKCQEHLGDPR